MAALAIPTSALASGSIGIAVAQSSQPYRSYKDDTIPAPFVSWEGQRFYFRGADVGFKLVEGQSSTLSVAVSPVLNRYKARDSSDLRMRQLDDRRFLGAAGVDWKVHGSWGVVNAKLQAEITGVGGMLADLKYSYPMPIGKVIVVPEIGAAYQSEEITRHYYRVSENEAARSGMKQYTPGDSLTPYGGVTLIMPLSEKWSATASIRRAVLSNSITNSPMTNSDFQDTAVITLSRAF
ncbi:MipA/OmpV family protein [Stenotrophomonas sp. S39]|uniref:MipA/OmpV family protein n=1 Tax=Stenotrophomonas sp. S39 TaxID=2767451 RepID=UPI00190983CF|nr:MipA/OmpV family protein [Stenotrophomonas sp. S39]MBK0053092.1 MipA/OmpV family protein [Stenotrophomonas sp. S39]